MPSSYTTFRATRADAPGGVPAHAHAGQEYGFLVGRCIDQPTLERACDLADRWGVTPHAVMIALGWVGEDAYVRALARHWGLRVAASSEIAVPASAAGHPGAARAPRIIEATSDRPHVLWRRLALRPGETDGPLLAGRQSIETAWQMRFGQRMLERATNGLRRSRPSASAATGLSMRQALHGVAVAGLFLGTVLVAPEFALLGWTMALTLPFLLVVLVRLVAVGYTLRSRSGPGMALDPALRLADHELPVYSILVPLYREAHMLQPLLTALQKFDYPAARLDVKIVLEAADPETLAAARKLDLPGHVSLVVVPDGQPRTKPKALNYALQLARGDLVAIYDAEDAPEPDQLRKAVAAFLTLPPEYACLQARLNIHNRHAGWITRQFTLEYCALFDGLLPCLARLGLPLPLGGTSNHFRKAALVACGAWDPYNVTEDADLGLRLHRLGWRTGVIASTTYEEAPERLRDWIPQRTRWLKGWMQTYLVHTRTPAKPQARQRPLPFLDPGRSDGWARGAWTYAPTRDAASWRVRLPMAIGVHVLLGGLLLSILVHPLVYVLLLGEVLSGQVFGRPQSLMGASFWHLAIANFALGFLASLALAALTAVRRGYVALSLRVVMMPLYWLLISFAGYRAVWQLVRDPFRWEKTEHGRHPASEK